jgi:hypothetical protein
MNELTPSQKGAVAEAAITAASIQLGLVVLRPLCEGRRDYEFPAAMQRLQQSQLEATEP